MFVPKGRHYGIAKTCHENCKAKSGVRFGVRLGVRLGVSPPWDKAWNCVPHHNCNGDQARHAPGRALRLRPQAAQPLSPGLQCTTMAYSRKEPSWTIINWHRKIAPNAGWAAVGTLPCPMGSECWESGAVEWTTFGVPAPSINLALLILFNYCLILRNTNLTNF